ncbi:MAG: hypothetical protein WBG30_12560 [Psychrilyobacter sp.]|uniref:hypothetical protein n=1 Tax=Psychrilyobacter sp. TaxID=2586924 RepID=UPI003C72EEDF
MTKKQVLFWRFILILIVVSGGYFLTLNISNNKTKIRDRIVEINKKVKGIDSNKNNEKTIENEIELSIRPDDFYKKTKNKK